MWYPVPNFMYIEGENVEAVTLLFSWAPKSATSKRLSSFKTVTTVRKLKESYDKPRENIKKLRHHFATKVHIIKDVVFPAALHGCESWTIKKIEC